MLKFLKTKLRKHTISEVVTICIPVYNAAPFLRETINSVLKQKHPHIQILISLDQSTDKTDEIIAEYADNSKIKTYYHDRRLGWVDNINFLLSKVDTRYFVILPHDDILDRSYVHKLVHALKKNPQAVAAYSDISSFGERQGKIVQKSVCGNLLTRIVKYIELHYSAVVFRALIDQNKVGDSLKLNKNRFSDFSEDTIFGLRLAIQGELLRVPKVLYHKRYLPTSAHHQWQQWSDKRKIEAWIMHCNRVRDIVCSIPIYEKNKTIIDQALVNRLQQKKMDLWHRKTLTKESIHPKVLQHYPYKSTATAH